MVVVWEDRGLNLGSWGIDSIASSNVDNVSGLLDWIFTGPVWDWICDKVYLPSHVVKPG